VTAINAENMALYRTEQNSTIISIHYFTQSNKTQKLKGTSAKYSIGKRTWMHIQHNLTFCRGYIELELNTKLFVCE